MTGDGRNFHYLLFLSFLLPLAICPLLHGNKGSANFCRLNRMFVKVLRNRRRSGGLFLMFWQFGRLKARNGLKSNGRWLSVGCKEAFCEAWLRKCADDIEYYQTLQRIAEKTARLEVKNFMEERAMQRWALAESTWSIAPSYTPSRFARCVMLEIPVKNFPTSIALFLPRNNICLPHSLQNSLLSLADEGVFS